VAQNVLERVVARAPGRVNLIGEHTDYNDGFVLPCAIAYQARTEARRRTDQRIAAVSREAASPAGFDLRALPERPAGDWGDYVRAAIGALQCQGVAVAGADLQIAGTVPMGAGLSSSTALDVSAALALAAVSGSAVDRKALVRDLAECEARYVGVRAGIMDQFTALYGEAGHALLIDTRSLVFEAVAVPPQWAIVICNSMVKHENRAGDYNVRRAQCEESVRRMSSRYPGVRQLRDVTPAQLEGSRDLLDDVLYRRAHHVVWENARVVDAVEALHEEDAVRFGTLMNLSHESLRTGYEVSSVELDALVAIALQIPGAYGARMTGGGFGGCTVNLVDAAQAVAFRERIAAAYQAQTGITPQIYDGTPSAGASVGSIHA
jgi:galactokinase